jgi:hypothetical protein
MTWDKSMTPRKLNSEEIAKREKEVVERDKETRKKENTPPEVLIEELKKSGKIVDE